MKGSKVDAELSFHSNQDVGHGSLSKHREKASGSEKHRSKERRKERRVEKERGSEDKERTGTHSDMRAGIKTLITMSRGRRTEPTTESDGGKTRVNIVKRGIVKRIMAKKICARKIMIMINIGRRTGKGKVIGIGIGIGMLKRILKGQETDLGNRRRIVKERAEKGSMKGVKFKIESWRKKGSERKILTGRRIEKDWERGRDRDRGKDREKGKDKAKDRERYRDRERAVEYEGDKLVREKDRDKLRDKERGKESVKEKEQDEKDGKNQDKVLIKKLVELVKWI